MFNTPSWPRLVAVSCAVLGLCGTAQAARVDVTVTVQNLAPANSISFAPLHVGFHNGSFDAFDLGGVATAPIISVAEGGAGDLWQAAFAAADPMATRGTIGGLLQPGASRQLAFSVDTQLNPFFTFAAMAVPSNDFFIGNDDPMAYRLFDAAGQLRNRLDRRQGPRDLGRWFRGVRPGRLGLRRQQRPAPAAELGGRPQTSPSSPATTA